MLSIQNTILENLNNSEGFFLHNHYQWLYCCITAGHMECYFGLAAQFRTQDEPAYCGLSTLVMVLNTLQVCPM